MKPIICIPKIVNKNQLAELQNSEYLAPGVNVVYIYYLVGKLVPYPKRKGNILYIGEAMRNSEPTGVRFRQHITRSAISGADTGNNLTLSQYFHAGWDIGLSIFETNSNRTDRERDLIYAHISRFGAPPIAQGKTPHNENGRNRTTHIFQFIENNKVQIIKAEAILRLLVIKYGLTWRST